MDELSGISHRHSSDVVRSIVGGVTLACSAVVALAGAGPAEVHLFKIVNDLPDALGPIFVVVMQCGTFVAVGCVAAAALFVQRRIVARDVLVSGLAAWIVAKLLKVAVGRARPAEILLTVRHDVRELGLGFPSGHAAVATAIATAIAPHVSRPVRRMLYAVAAAVCVARVYVGAHFPLDVVGGAALGWLVGSLTHLVFKAPDGIPSTTQVLSDLATILPGAHNLRVVSADARGSTPLLVDADGSTLFAKLLTANNRDADALFKVWRWVMYRRVEDEQPFSTAKREAEHEALCMAEAERVGVRAPRFRGMVSNPRVTLLLMDSIANATGADSADAQTVRAAIGDVWLQVRRLHEHQIAHRDLRLANIMLDSSGAAWLIDYGFSEISASPNRISMDVAELLVSSAAVIGVDDAVIAAIEAIGTEQVAASLAYLQPMALSSDSRARAGKTLLAELRTQVAALTGANASVDYPLAKLARFNKRRLFGFALLGMLAMYLATHVGDLRRTVDEVSAGNWRWVAVAAGFSALTYAGAALSIISASGQPISFGRGYLAQVASSFANRLAPGGVGGMGLNVRFLMKSSLTATQASAAVALSSVAGVVVHVILLSITATMVGRRDVTAIHAPSSLTVAIVAAVVLAVLGIVLGVSSVRAKVKAPLISAVQQLRDIFREPNRALGLFSGALITTLSYIAAFAASLTAFGIDLKITSVAFAYLAGDAVGAASPTPGGLGAAEAALVAALVSMGQPAEKAVAAVLAFRLVTYWLPVIPGGVSLRFLTRKQEL